MAISQDNGLQQQPQPAEHAPIHDSDAQAGPTNQTANETHRNQPSQGTATGARTPTRRNPTHKHAAQSSQEAAEGEVQSADEGLGQALEQQIAQAIQPMLDEFWHRMAQELSDQLAVRPKRSAGASDTSQEATHTPDTQAPAQSAALEATPQQSEGEQALIQVRNIKGRPQSGALPSMVQMVGRYSAQWLQSLLVAGLGALLAESTHAAVQQRAEQSLHTLLQKAFEAAPPDFANQEIQKKAERTLQLILREALDAVFAEGVRAAVQEGGKQTIQQSLRGDFGGALRKVEKMPKVMIAALIVALRRHQQTVIRLLLALALLGVGSSLEHSEKAK